MLLVQAICRACVCVAGLAHAVHCSGGRNAPDDLSPPWPLRRSVTDPRNSELSKFRKWAHRRFADTFLGGMGEDLEARMADFVGDLDSLLFPSLLVEEYTMGGVDLMSELSSIADGSEGDDVIFFKIKMALGKYYDCTVRVLGKAMLKSAAELRSLSFPAFDRAAESGDSEFGAPMEAQPEGRVVQITADRAVQFRAYILELVALVARWHSADPDVRISVWEKLDALFDQGVVLNMRAPDRECDSPGDARKGERTRIYDELVRILSRNMAELVAHLRRRSENTSSERVLLEADMEWCERRIFAKPQPLIGIIMDLGRTCAPEIQNWNKSSGTGDAGAQN